MSAARSYDHATVERTLVEMVRDHGYRATLAVIESSWAARQMNWPAYNQLLSAIKSARRLARKQL